MITREDIESSGATSVHEILSLYPGIIFYDNVGNGAETTVDLRGFADGTSMAVYLDGARINEPDDNRVNFELIDLDTIERIEIIPGGSSFSHGNGALSGVVRLYTGVGDAGSADKVFASYGSFETKRAGFTSGRGNGTHGYLVSYSLNDSEGFRDNGGVNQHKFLGKYSFKKAGSYALDLSYRYSTSELGNPGALTAEEMAADREQNPYNEADFNDSSEQMLTIDYSQTLGDDASFSLVAHRRDAEIEVLTTGRSAALYGGFSSKSDHAATGLAGQLNYAADMEGFGVGLSAGFEASMEDFTNLGYYTTLTGEHTFLSNDRDTEQDSGAFFLQGSLTAAGFLTFTGGVRYDKVKMDYLDNYDGTSGDREFSETTGLFGVSAEVVPGTSVFARYSQAFQVPTVTELFAYPLYGSNPDLEPITGDTYEGGVRAWFAPGWSAQASVYRMDLENEIVFVITDPIWYLGENRNVGESRRTGLDLQLQGAPAPGLRLMASYNYIKTENISDAEDAGVDELRIPLVPEHKLAFKTTYSIGDMSFGGDLLYVGKQVMDSDTYNAGPLLDAYTVANLMAIYDFGNWYFRLDLRNALDEEYETRAFYSYGSTYYTPAAGRQVLATIGVKY